MTDICQSSDHSSVVKYYRIVLQLALSQLRAEVSWAYLGIAWWVIEPVIYMLVFFVVFGLVFERGGPGFVPLLLTGLVTWRWFANTTNASMTAISKNKALMQQVYIPKILFIGVVIIVSTLKFLIVFFFMMVFLIIFGIEPAISWFALPIIFIVELVFVSAVAFLVGLIVPFLPDLRIIITNAMLLLFFVSGVFFMAMDVPENLRGYFFLNPMAVLIDAMRETLIVGNLPDWSALLWVFLSGCAGLAIAVWLFRRYDFTYPKLGF